MTEREVPPPKAHRGRQATDDHAAGEARRGAGQPIDELDKSTDDEHHSSPGQGVPRERTPDEVEPGT